MVKDNLSPKDLKKTSKVLDFYGYESMLLTFHSDESDYWIKAANAIDTEDKIKYMIAIRPYAITAAYCSMIIKGFNEIQNNRMSLNIIAGTHDEDQQLFCSPTSIDERKKSSGLFVKDLRSINDHCPEIFFSGSSKETVENVARFGDGQILTLSKFNEEGKQSNRSIVRLSVIIDDDAKTIYDSMQNMKEKSNTIYGSKEEVISKISALEDMGVTDILISNTSFGSNNSEIHEVVLEMIGNSNASI